MDDQRDHTNEPDVPDEPKEANGTYPVARPDPEVIEPRRDLYSVDPKSIDDSEPFDAERFQFSLAELLLLMALASLILGILGCFPRKYAAGLSGLGALVSMLVIAVLKPTRAIIYVAWWVILGIYLLTCIGEILTGR